MYIVKDTPIFANKKLYKVGEKFPYSNSEKHLLWNLIEIKDGPKEEAPKETDSFEAPKVEELISKTETPKIEATKPKFKAKIKSKKATK